MAIRDVVVFIYLPGEVEAVPAGRFWHDDQLQVGEFAYGRQYLQRQNGLPVDPIACPLEGPISPTRLLGGIYGAFRDSAPDHWGRLVIARTLQRAPEQISEIDYLVEGGQSRAGCLDFRERSDSPEAKSDVPRIADLESLIDAARRIEADLPVSDDERDLLRQGTAMGGARPKCVVEHDRSLWLAKFPSRNDRFDNARVECATMHLAASCGIRVAETQLKPIVEGRDVVLVKRFDRANAAGGFARTGFVSALTVLGVDEGDRRGWSYRALAALMRRHLENPEDLTELYRRVVFNVACRNTDDHPRNHGFLYGKGGRLQLSPAYDITPSAAIAGVGTEFDLAMSIGDEGPRATVANLLSAAPDFGLRHRDAVQIITGIGSRVLDWDGHFARFGVTEADRQKFTGTFLRAGEMATIADGAAVGVEQDVADSPTAGR